METLIIRHGLDGIARTLRRYESPAVGFYLPEERTGRSRFGGAPLLPPGSCWPAYTPMLWEYPYPAGRRPELRPGEPYLLDFLLQIDLADIRRLAPAQGVLPESGLRSKCLSLVAGSRPVPA